MIKPHEAAVRNYIRAKDDNKPHLMKAAFTTTATLEMKVASENISFPSDTRGLSDIADVLVRTFSQKYENVYTFCVTESVETRNNAMSCDWLVGMSGRDDGNVQVGCGRYDWQFTDTEPTLVDQLTISIQQMIVLSPDTYNEVFTWLASVPYPFCDAKDLLRSMPDFGQLGHIRGYISAG